MQFQIVCDPSKLIRAALLTIPEVSMMQRCIQHLQFSIKRLFTYTKRIHFGRFSISDPNLAKITQFRKRQGSVHVRYRTFNKQLSSQRVLVEHTIGLLNGRFQSLQGLRINVCKTGGHICRGIQACDVLPNILGQIDPWNQGDEDDLDQQNNSLMPRDLENNYEILY